MVQKHIAVVNGLWVGHHPTYVKTLVRILLESGYRVSLFCPAPEDVSSWVDRTFLKERSCFIAYFFSDQEPSWLWRHMYGKIRYALWSLPRWFHISRSLRSRLTVENKPDLVFFVWIDCYLIGYLPIWLIDRLFPFYWSGLYFHPRQFRILNSKKVRFAASPENLIAQSKWATSIAVLDAGIVSALRSKLFGKQAVILPDFSDELPPFVRYYLAEEIRAKSNGRKIIGLLGGLSRRKGLLTLIRIVEQSTIGDWYFVFAGVLLEHTFSKDELTEIKLFFNTQREDCFFHLNKIPDDSQFNALVNVCDVMFAMYENFPHSSNLITKSAIYGKSVLVSTGGYMEEVVRRYKLGEAVPAGDVTAVLEALKRLKVNGQTHENLAGMKEYARKQSQENLRESFLNLVETSISYATSGSNITN